MGYGALVKAAGQSALRLALKVGSKLTARSAMELAKKMARSIVTKLRNKIGSTLTNSTMYVKQGLKQTGKIVNTDRSPSIGDLSLGEKRMQELYSGN